MTTKEHLHRIIDETPEDELPRAFADLFVQVLRVVVSDKDMLDALLQHPDLVRAYILSSPKWMQDIETAAEESRLRKGMRAKEFFASLQQ